MGAIYGKVRAMFDDHGRPVIEALPSSPAEVLGLEDVPQAGDRLQVIEDTLKARQIALHRQGKLRDAALAKSARLTLEQLHAQLAAGDVKELPLIIKADVQGSVEVLAETLIKLSTDRVKIKVIHAGAGAITESDVLLASASNAVIIGFNVRPERKATELAQLEQVDIRLHTIIYNVTDEIKKAMVGLLAITYKETILGRAEVRDTFRITKVGTVAGCYIQDGKITRDRSIRLVRDNVVVHEGKIRSLRRFKEDVGEVKSGMECGISLENYNDVKVGDVIEAYVKERVPSLPWLEVGQALLPVLCYKGHVPTRREKKCRSFASLRMTCHLEPAGKFALTCHSERSEGSALGCGFDALCYCLLVRMRTQCPLVYLPWRSSYPTLTPSRKSVLCCAKCVIGCARASTSPSPS